MTLHPPQPMNSMLRGLVLILLALGIHVALARILLPAGAEAEGGEGNQGESMVTVRAASGALAEMVRTWERAPQPAANGAVPASMPPLPAPPIAAVTPTASRDRTARHIPQPVRPQLPALPAAAPALITTPAPPPPPARRKLAEPAADGKTATVRPNRQEAGTGPGKQARPAGAAQPARIARGGGKAATAGSRGRLDRPSLNAGQRRAVLQSWGASIRARIARFKRYPPGARMAGQGGSVRVSLVVTRKGELSQLAIVGGSGVAALDRAALSAVRDAAPLPRAPANLPGRRFRFLLTITFRP